MLDLFVLSRETT